METINQILAVCGGIVTVGGAVTILYNWYKHYKKPTDDLKKRIESLEKRMDTMDQGIKDINKKLDNDYASISSNREDTNLIMRSLFCLIENKLTGNNVGGLKKTRDDLINALTDKQVM